jgi:hypothetical protein
VSLVNPFDETAYVDLVPVVVETITYAPHAAATVEHSTIAVPREAVVRQVRVFMPPGTNGSVRLQVGYLGRRYVPTTDTDDYIYGSGFEHRYPWDMPVTKEVDVWAWCWNSYSHEITVSLDLDYKPMLRAAQPVPRRVI